MIVTPSIRLIIIVLAFVLFAVAAYLSPNVPDKLTRIAFALIVLAWMF